MVLTFASERVKNQIANFFRTRSAILMKARRLHHKAGEEEEKIPQLAKAIQIAISARETDTVETKVNEAVKSISEMMHELAQSEETEILSEYDAVHPFDEVIEWMQRLRSSLERLQKKGVVVQAELSQADLVLRELEVMKKLEIDTIKAQYTALLRALKGEKGNWQTMVVALNERMSASKAMWRERSEVRAVVREEKDEKRDIYEALELIEELAKSDKIEDRRKLDNSIAMILQQTKELHKEFVLMLQDFLLIINVLVHEWFEYDHEATEMLQHLDEALTQHNFPPQDLSIIREEEQHWLKDKKHAIEIVTRVAQRMGRIEINA